MRNISRPLRQQQEHHRDKEQGKEGGRSQAADNRQGQGAIGLGACFQSKRGRDKPNHGGQAGHGDGYEPGASRGDDGLDLVHAFVEAPIGIIDEQDAVGHRDANDHQDPHQRCDRKRQMKTSPIFGLMLLAIAVIAGLAYVDEEREGAAALADFAQEQTTLAQSLAMALSAQLSSAPHDASTLSPSHPAERPEIPSVLERYLSLMVRPSGAGKPPNRLMVLLQPPDTAQFYSTEGRLMDAPEIHAALKDGQTYLRLTPAEASRLGLPARTAMAGLSRLDTGAAGAWGIAAVASAERERDRARWARWRLLLSVAAASSLVLSFGGLAMRNQRKELLLRHRLELADVSGQRDDRLQRAGRAATMGTLAVGVAHEISTPLGIIAGRAEQLVPKLANDERAAGSVRIILEQIDRIHRIIRGLLGLARGDRPTAEPVEPAALVAGAVTLVEHRFAKAGVRLLIPW